MEQSFEELMRKAQEGDKVAYASLLQELRVLVERYLYKRVSIREDIPDIAQEILVSIHKARHSYQPDKPLLPWLYAICYYRLQDYFRQSYRSKEDACDDFSSVMDILDAPADARLEKKELLKKALSCLNDKQRNIVEKLYFHECSAKEVAAQLNISVADVRTTAHRSIRKLREQMETLI